MEQLVEQDAWLGATVLQDAQMPKQTMDVVIPVFDEIEIVDQLHSRVAAACLATDLDFRIIYVDDGSHDGTPQWLQENAVQSPQWRNSNRGNVKLIQLSRNFGQPAAILAGLRSSSSECVVLMDGDLQDPPELISEMIDAWQSGSEVVIAQRTGRQESFLRGICFKTFHRVFRYLSDSNIPPNTGTFCLMDRKAAQSICDLPESHRFFPGLRAWVGFKQTMVNYKRPERAGGEPKQTFSRLFRYAMDAIFGYSLKPLRLLTGTGIAICIAAFTLASWFIFKRVVGWESASIGFTTLTCAVFCLGGFQLIGMGILGEYIGRIYDESKGRPPFLISSDLDSADIANRSQVNDKRFGVVSNSDAGPNEVATQRDQSGLRKAG